jgi:hypothetical protein
MQQLFITIADLTVAVTLPPSDLLARLRQRYDLFLAPPSAKPLVTIECKLTEGARFIAAEPNTTWISNVSLEGNMLYYESYRERGEFNLVTGRATIELAPSADIENFLRVIYAWLCLQHDSLLLHAAGVVKDGQGYVFFGPSGAGKSTTASLSADVATILSDDIVIIRKRDDSYHLCGVPFFGELTQFPPCNMSVPLKGLYRLQQDVWSHVEPLTNVLAVAELGASAPFIVQHSALSSDLLTTCYRLAQSVPVRELYFNRTPAFWKIIEA